MSETDIERVRIEAPFKQRRYLELMKEKILAAKQGSGDDLEAAMEELHGMVDVLINDDTVQMDKALPHTYYEIVGYRGMVFGKTSDPDDMWHEEPNAKVRPITKEEFDKEDE